MDMKRLITLLLALSFLLTSCLTGTPTPPPPTPLPATAQATESAPESGPAAWWRDAVFYEIFVRSFNDSNGDGIGDFNGITQKLDYLQSLGVNAIWLMPINPSPSYHGYDVLNYYTVNPQYGTMDDFKHLLAEAHKRDIKIIIDLVLNHTSSQHPFFVDANNNPESKYRDWYVWSNEGGDRWHQGKNGYYYGYFWGGMPDLNYNNPEVTAQMEAVTQHWLTGIGVDGFRIDAVKHLIEEGNKLENTPATHEWLKGYYTFYKSLSPEAYTVGEVYGAGAFLATKYTNQTDQIFNFELASGFVNSVLGESNTGLNGAWAFTLKDITDGNYATFLTNHDQNRVMSVFNGDMQKAKLAAVLMLTSPGTPFIYYGEEIGMQGKKPDEDIRLPMQWSAAANAGFTTGTPWRAPFANYTEVNVAVQDADPNSLINLYRTLTKLRAEHPALRRGQIAVLDTDNPGVFAMLRTDGAEHFLILVNLKGEAISNYALKLNEKLLPDGSLTAVSQLDSASGSALTITGGLFADYKPLPELPPYQAYIFALK